VDVYERTRARTDYVVDEDLLQVPCQEQTDQIDFFSFFLFCCEISKLVVGDRNDSAVTPEDCNGRYQYVCLELDPIFRREL